jgi:drug/metabolite transporter (DMT)-like permease
MKSETKSWFILILLACVWGSSFILMKRGMQTMDGEPIFTDMQVGALRIFFASTILLPFSLRAIFKIKQGRDLLLLFVVGFCGNFIPAFLFTYAETSISSGYAGMLNSFTPIFTVIIGFLVFKVHLNTIQIIGLTIGTIGMVLLMYSGNLGPTNGGLIHVLAIVLATFLYSISLNTIKHKLSHFSAVEITSLSLLLVLIPALVANGYFGTLQTIRTNEHAWEGLGYIAVLGIVGTAFAVIIFNQIIALRDALFASSVTYFIPIVAVFIGFGFKEQINIAQIGSMCIVLLGVFFVNYWPQLQSKRKARALRKEAIGNKA